MQIQMILRVSGLLALLLGSLLVGDVLAETAKVKVGVLLPLTGEVADYGSKLRQGIERATSSTIEFLYEDDACRSANALTAYENLRRKGVRYFLGPCCGAAMKTVAPRLASGNQLTFGSCPVSDEAFHNSNGRVLQPQYSVEDEAAFNAREMHRRGLKKVVVLFQESAFARSQEEIFRKKFEGDVVASLVYDFADLTALRPLLLKLKTLDYDALFIPHVEPLLLGLMREMMKVGMSPKNVFSIYSAQMQEVLEQNGPAAEGLIYSYPDIPLHEDAISYFPKLAVEMLDAAFTRCGDEYACVRKHLADTATFSSSGVLQQPIVLRTVKNGVFALLEP